MTRRLFLAILSGLTLDLTRRAATGQQSPPGSQPSTAPADDGFRKPVQARDLDELMRRQEATPVLPVAPEAAGDRRTADRDREAGSLLVDGTRVVDRPGRLIRSGQRSEFEFYVEEDSGAPRVMEILKNQFLEAMEREAEGGASEFVISAEVTRYRGANYLLLRKVLRRLSHGNLAP